MEKVKVTMENGGEFIIELCPEQAPITCENFLKLVKSGFYNGLTFHRVIDGFMAQGGDPEGTGCGGSDENIKGEFRINGVNNTLSHTRGVISMARSSNPNSASSQFFICYGDCTFLDGQYAAFGKVTEGMEVVDDFLKIERRMSFGGERSTPVEPIVMKTVVTVE
jgi:peptidyl-prolyl cis-trans isomerase B (cyclophilin B)